MEELELELRFKLILYNRLLLDFEHNISESRSSHQKCSIKKDVLKISQILQEKTFVRVFFKIKACFWKMKTSKVGAFVLPGRKFSEVKPKKIVTKKSNDVNIHWKLLTQNKEV